MVDVLTTSRSAYHVSVAPVCQRLMALQRHYQGRPVDNIGQTMLEVFAPINPKVYAVFCAAQKQAVELYHTKLKQSPAFAQLLGEIEGRLECQRLRFSDFNAKVMQRLSKYPLLLEGILKSMPRISVFRSESDHLRLAIKKAREFMQVHAGSVPPVRSQ